MYGVKGEKQRQVCRLKLQPPVSTARDSLLTSSRTISQGFHKKCKYKVAALSPAVQHCYL